MKFLGYLFTYLWYRWLKFLIRLEWEHAGYWHAGTYHAYWRHKKSGRMVVQLPEPSKFSRGGQRLVK